MTKLDMLARVSRMIGEGTMSPFDLQTKEIRLDELSDLEVAQDLEAIFGEGVLDEDLIELSCSAMPTGHRTWHCETDDEHFFTQECDIID